MVKEKEFAYSKCGQPHLLIGFQKPRYERKRNAAYEKYAMGVIFLVQPFIYGFPRCRPFCIMEFSHANTRNKPSSMLIIHVTDG